MGDTPLRPLGRFYSHTAMALVNKKAGTVERFNVVRNDLRFYSSLQLTVSYLVPRSLVRNFGSTQELVYAVLNELLSLHPILGVTVSSPAAVSWIRLESIDLGKVVKEINSDPQVNLDRIIEEGHRETSFELDGDLPLWRVVLVAPQSGPEAADEKGEGTVRFAVGIFCHHAIGDGLSTRAFQHTFLGVLNRFITQAPFDKPTPKVVTVPKLQLLPNLEMETKLRVSFLFVLKEIFSAFVYARVDSHLWTGPPISAERPRPPRGSIHSFLLPAPALGKLLSRCREEKTTVTALISVLVAQKLALMNRNCCHFTGGIPFSMRKFTDRSFLDMGCYVSSVGVTFSSSPSTHAKHIPCSSISDLWASARSLKKEMNRQASSIYDQPVGLLKFIATSEKMKSYFLGLLGGVRKDTFELSNIGVVGDCLDEELEGKVTIERSLYTQAPCVYGPPYNFNVVSVKGGGMSIALTWEEEIVKREEAVGILGWLEAELKGIGRV
jgi:hypothetical protein